MQPVVGFFHVVGNPSPLLMDPHFVAAAAYYLRECGVYGHRVFSGFEDFFHAFRNVKLFRKKDKTRIGRPPQDLASLIRDPAFIRIPRKDPRLVGKQKPFRSQIPADSQKTVRLRILDRRKTDRISRQIINHRTPHKKQQKLYHIRRIAKKNEQVKLD